MVCSRSFTEGLSVDSDKLWQEYTEGKQTYKQLSLKYNLSLKTIQRRLDSVRIKVKAPIIREVVILIDTTYFGRAFGLMLFKDAFLGENLLKYYVKQETNGLYKTGIEHLKAEGYEIKGIVCDGRRGLIQSFKEIPVQMCQFHQVAIITKYLTKRPKIEATKELKKLTLMLVKTDKESFTGGLNDWHVKWKDFLNERTINTETGKSFYTHKRLRSAYRSLKSNLPWLFTYYDYPHLGMPNTTNAIDGHFSDLKNKLRNHNGLSLRRKKKFINNFLKIE